MPFPALRPLGRDLNRPECVLAAADGTIAVPDWRGGVMLIAADGRQRLIQGPGWLRPNGIALDRDGSFVVAHLDDHVGGVFRLHPDGTCEPVLTEILGRPLPPTNFPLIDEEGRIWVTVSTWHVPRHSARSYDIADGFIVLIDRAGPRIVADRLGFTNEVRISPDGRSLLAVETFGRRILRFPLAPDGTLGPREVAFSLERGLLPDGIELDEEGGLWIVCVGSNRVLRAIGSSIETVIDAGDAGFVRALDAQIASGAFTADLPLTPPPSPLGNCSSIAFAGTDRKTAILGCLHGDRLTAFAVAIPGVRPTHWDRRMPAV